MIPPMYPRTMQYPTRMSLFAGSVKVVVVFSVVSLFVYQAIGMIVSTPEQNTSTPPTPTMIQRGGWLLQQRAPGVTTARPIPVTTSEATIMPCAIGMIWLLKYSWSVLLRLQSYWELMDEVLQMSQIPWLSTMSEDWPLTFCSVRQLAATVLVRSRTHPHGASTRPMIIMPGVRISETESDRVSVRNRRVKLYSRA